jgi:polyisoprenoid-binding protein YceI
MAGFILAVALGLILGGANGADVRLATAAPSIPAVSDSAGAPPSPVAVSQAPVDDVLHFAGDPAQSSAKILVNQTGLLGDSVLVANGSNVTGDIYLTRSGQLADAQSGFQLDLRTLRSNDSALNSLLKSDLEAERFPFAEFVAESADGIPASYMDGNEFSFTLTGPLTMHGRTKTATWTIKARQAGRFLTFVADTDFLLTDYGWTPPNYGVARAKNSVHLQVLVLAVAP